MHLATTVSWKSLHAENSISATVPVSPHATSSLVRDVPNTESRVSDEREASRKGPREKRSPCRVCLPPKLPANSGLGLCNGNIHSNKWTYLRISSIIALPRLAPSVKLRKQQGKLYDGGQIKERSFPSHQIKNHASSKHKNHLRCSSSKHAIEKPLSHRNTQSRLRPGLVDPLTKSRRRTTPQETSFLTSFVFC